ncbi:MAG: hypothetical protein ACXAEN_24125 [Candidatus Thorarchaeota archaeon]|jgi:hypothetical protein
MTDGVKEPSEVLKGIIKGTLHMYGVQEDRFMGNLVDALMKAIFTESNLHNLLWMITEIEVNRADD